MGYDSGDSSPFDFELNGIPFGSKSKGKLSPRSYPIQCERKWKHSFLGAARQTKENNTVETGTSRHHGESIEGHPVRLSDIITALSY